MSGCNFGNQNSASSAWTDFKFIAHAAGEIDNKQYTNSLEAFQESYEKGYRLFEVDLSLTSDGKVVARHGWKKKYGQEFDENEGPLSYEEFMNRPYYGKYTPLDFAGVLKLMEEYEDAYVIIDSKVSSVDDTRKIYKRIGKAIEDVEKGVKNRLIPQMFYEKDLEVIRQYGFQDVLYVVGREEYTQYSIAEFCKTNNIQAVSLSKSRTNQLIIDKLSKEGIEIYMYTLNDVDEMENYLDAGVTGFFTDNVTPIDNQNS